METQKFLNLSKTAIDNNCNIHNCTKNEWFNSLSFLEKLNVLKCGVDKMYKEYESLCEYEKKVWLHYKKFVTDESEFYINILYSYFKKLSANSVTKAMIQFVGIEATCKISGKSYKDGIVAKKQSYIDAYTFNIFGAEVALDVIEGLEVGNKYGKNFKFLGFPTLEQFEYAILRPDNIPYVTLHINDFGASNCIDTDKIVLDYSI